MLSAGRGRSRCQVKGGANQSGHRQSSPAPGIAAFDFEVEAPLPQKKCAGTNQFQSGRWLHVAQPLSARQTVDGTEDHRLHDGDAGSGQFRDAIEQARTDPVTGAVAGSLIRPLCGALSSNYPIVAATAVSARANFGPRLERSRCRRHRWPIMMKLETNAPDSVCFDASR